MRINNIRNSAQIDNLGAHNGNKSYYCAYNPWHMINIEDLANYDNSEKLEYKSFLRFYNQVDGRL